ncbi:MAG TPA: endonuclease III [Kofleriaceae bacterium]|nr:endonuclease III [Kofleriaceae bacterium]
MDAIVERLGARWPDARCELDHTNAFELLCATILAAQSTDRLVNTVTPALFTHWPDARALAAAPQEELERAVHSTGFFRMKARHLLGMAQALVERHGGEVPPDMEALCALPGVARKTANVILGTVFQKDEGVVVDTHVTRLSQRLGLTRENDPAKIEKDLMAQLPKEHWRSFADRLIWHGRRVCFAKQPACGLCDLAPLCPSADMPGREAELKQIVMKAKANRKAKAAATASRTASGKAKAKAKVNPAKKPVAKPKRR